MISSSEDKPGLDADASGRPLPIGGSRPPSGLKARPIHSRSRAANARIRDGLWGRWRDREGLATAAALSQERRRVAAEIHDLIMQDLSLALATARTLVEQDSAQALHAAAVVAAGERALAGARALLGSLTERDREPLVDALEGAVRVLDGSTPVKFSAEGVPADAGAPAGSCFGLTSMRRHADALGGSLTLTSAAGVGTRIEVALP